MKTKIDIEKIKEDMRQSDFEWNQKILKPRIERAEAGVRALNLLLLGLFAVVLMIEFNIIVTI